MGNSRRKTGTPQSVLLAVNRAADLRHRFGSGPLSRLFPGCDAGQFSLHYCECERRLDIRVAWSTPLLSQLPSQITRSPSFTLVTSISSTFLLPCCWATQRVELSYCTVLSSLLEPTLRTVKVDLS